MWYGAQDATTTMTGYLFLTANLAISVSRGVVQRWTYSTMRQSVLGIAAIESTLSLPLIVTLCFASGEWRAASPDASLGGEAPSLFVHGLMQPWRAWAESDALLWKCLVMVTSFFVGFIGISYTQLFRYLAATTVTVIGSVDKTIAVVAGAFLFGDHIGVGQAAALALTLVAGGAYVFLRKHRLQIARAASELEGGAFDALDGECDDVADAADAALHRHAYSSANGAAESEALLRRLEMVAASRDGGGDSGDVDDERRHRGDDALDFTRDLERGSRDAASDDASGAVPLRSLAVAVPPPAGRGKSPRRRSNLSPKHAMVPTAERPALVGLSAALGDRGARSPNAGEARSPTPEQLHTIARRALGETQVVEEMETLLAQAFDKGRAAVKSGDITRSELHLIKERLEKIRRAPAHSPSRVPLHGSRGGDDVVSSPTVLSPLNLGACVRAAARASRRSQICVVWRCASESAAHATPLLSRSAPFFFNSPSRARRGEGWLFPRKNAHPLAVPAHNASRRRHVADARSALSVVAGAHRARALQSVVAILNAARTGHAPPRWEPATRRALHGAWLASALPRASPEDVCGSAAHRGARCRAVQRGARTVAPAGRAKSARCIGLRRVGRRVRTLLARA